MTSTIQRKRYDETLAQIAKTSARREEAIRLLVRLDAKLTDLRKQEARYKKRLVRAVSQELAPMPAPAPEKPEPAKANDVTDIPVTELPIADDLSLPDFLKRSKDADERDRAAREEIKREQDEIKQAKARGRLAARKAKLSGETRRMPLQGRAALEAIRRGG